MVSVTNSSGYTAHTETTTSADQTAEVHYIDSGAIILANTYYIHEEPYLFIKELKLECRSGWINPRIISAPKIQIVKNIRQCCRSHCQK